MLSTESGTTRYAVVIRLILALVAGIALPFAFSPYDLWPLAFLSIALVFFLLQGLDVRSAIRVGAALGLGYFSFGVYWIYFSVSLFGGAVGPLATAITGLFILVMAVFPLACCALYAWFAPGCNAAGRKAPVLSAFLFAGLWLGTELLRGILFGGFPWLLLGYTQTDTVLSAYAPVVGVYGLSWVVVLSGCLLCVVVTCKNRVSRTVSALCLALAFSGAALLQPVEWTESSNEDIQFRLVQGNIKQELKFSRERLRDSLDKYKELSRGAPENTQLIVWPETAIPSLFKNLEEALAPFVVEMHERNIDVLSGGFYRNENNETFNSFKQLGEDGQLYAKGHLVPFGEFMPLRFLLQPLAKFVQIPMSDLSAAEAPAKPLRVRDWVLGISICYEDVFGEEMRAVLPAASMLINVSNDAWFGEYAAPHQHQQMARMRAREFERSMVRVTNTGITSSIDYRGNLGRSIPIGQEGVLDVSVSQRSGATPYVTLGLWPSWLITGIALLLGVTFRRQSREQ